MNFTPLRRVGAVAATLALAAGALAATATSAQAAGPTGIVTGVVTQPGGGAVAGAAVSLFQGNDPSTSDDNVSRFTIAGDDGTFALAAPAGTYEALIYDYCEQYLDIYATVTVSANGETAINGQFTTADGSPSSEFNSRACVRNDPKIAGLPQVGVPLTVSSPTFAQPGVAVSYQWRANDEPIPGATGPVYVPGSQDVGSFVDVQITGTKTGLANYTRTVYVDTTVKRGDYVFKKGPAVLGLPIVGKSVYASAGSLVPGAAVTYQWFRNGAAIAGQTGRAYKVAKADYGKKLAAVITYKTYGYATVVRSVAAPFAAKNAAKLSTKVSIAQKKATFTIKVSPSASKKAKGTITIRENDKILKRVSIKAKSVTVTVSNLKKGKHKLTIVYEGRKHAATGTKTVRIKK